MDEKQLRQILARNLERFMGDETQATVAKRAGIAQSHVSRLLRSEASATTDLLCALGRALGRQPFELLIDEEVTRRAVYEQMIIGPRGGMIQEAPRKEAAHSRRKKPAGRSDAPFQ